MDRGSVVTNLVRSKKVATKAVAGQRCVIGRILCTSSEKHIRILEPKDIMLDVDSIEETDENHLNDAT